MPGPPTAASHCLDCQQMGDGDEPRASPAGESSEERWCRREELSLIGLRAVKQTSEVVMSVLVKADLRQALYDPRNRGCPQTLHPARPLGRAVDCTLASLADVVGDGERVRQLSQLVETVVTPPQPSAGASAQELLVEAKRLDPEFSSSDPQLASELLAGVPICRNYNLGGGSCWSGGGIGDSCQYRHVTLADERPPNCPYYYSEQGCRFGSSCKFAHPRSALLNEGRLAASIVAGAPVYNSALASQQANGGGLRSLLADKNVMLVGEGDFGFALSLARGLDADEPLRPARLLASGLDDEAALRQKYPRWRERAEALRPLAALSHGVDATLLGESSSFREILRSTEVPLEAIGWQFPFNGLEDDSAGNSAMVQAFLRGVAAACWQHDRVDESFRLFITVHGEQAARWGLLRSARDAMLFLEKMLPFTQEEFDGYTPKQTAAPLEDLELKRPLTFVFRPCRPVAFAADGKVASGWDTESCSDDEGGDDAIADACDAAMGD